jgi:hypothetical protein
MKKILISCFAAVTLGMISGCASDKTHTTTSTSQETTIRSPVTTTTTDTQTK